MGFPSSISGARIAFKTSLVVQYQESGQTIPLTLDLVPHVAVVSGRFQWGNAGGLQAAKNLTIVSGSILQGNLNGQSRQIDLSTNIDVINGRLIYFQSRPGSRASTTQRGSTIQQAYNPMQASDPVTPGGTPLVPPPYTKHDEYSYRSYLKRQNISFNSVTSSEQYSSSYLEFSVGTTMRLEGSSLCAEARKSGEEVHTTSLRLELDEYIGVVNGKFVWGRTGFYSNCEKPRIEKFHLCATINVVTEHDSIGAVEAIKMREGKSVFESTFDDLATKTSDYVAEEAKEVFESAEAYLTSALFNDVKTEVTTLLHDGNEKMAKEAREALAQATTSLTEAQKALTEAQEAIVLAENALKKPEGPEVDIATLDALFTPLRAKIIQLCNERTEQYLTEVRVSAITHFRQRAEIMMEREIIAASIQRAQTQARMLEILMSGKF
ncbi:hypothetical protein BDP27DRAFT_1429027 [Rhodocollybia butyracea]|uniref:Cyanovirin-N domain-containing protein n=1 Tax=Rhodocollybia butyracea TaxID=206335 RepID=A0A9P5PDK3_9AGAR|nr:hypothetical protein BDP27DRAFT_1429027 [Rhodocollybia butyracea]